MKELGVLQDIINFDYGLLEKAPYQSEVLRSGHILSDEDQTVQLLERHQLDFHLSCVKKAIRYLKRELSLIEEARSWRSSMLSPVRLVPDEVLSDIFAIAASTSGSMSNPFHLHALPRVISQVCSRWRAVALSTPDVWFRVQLDANILHPRYDGQGRHEKTPSRIVEALSLWCARSSYRGLDLTLNRGSDSKPGSLAVSELFVHAISVMSPHLVGLTLRDATCIAQNLPDFSMPRLEKLIISDSFLKNNVVLNAPNLLHVGALDARGRRTLFTNVVFSWSRIRKLELILTRTNYQDYVVAIRNASATLEVLHLADFSLMQHPHWHVSLPRLTHLEISSSVSSSGCSYILNSLDAPALGHLLLHYNIGRWEQVFDFFDRCKCAATLKSLELGLHYDDDSITNTSCRPLAQHFVHLLVIVSKVEKLAIEVINSESKAPAILILELLAKLPNDGEALMPGLKSVSFKTPDMRRLESPLMAMMRTRIRPTHGKCAKIHTLRFQNQERGLRENLRVAQEEWINNGVDLFL
jgi:hypothetical protein